MPHSGAQPATINQQPAGTPFTLWKMNRPVPAHQPSSSALSTRLYGTGTSYSPRAHRVSPMSLVAFAFQTSSDSSSAASWQVRTTTAVQFSDMALTNAACSSMAPPKVPARQTDPVAFRSEGGLARECVVGVLLGLEPAQRVSSSTVSVKWHVELSGMRTGSDDRDATGGLGVDVLRQSETLLARQIVPVRCGHGTATAVKTENRGGGHAQRKSLTFHWTGSRRTGRQRRTRYTTR